VFSCDFNIKMLLFELDFEEVSKKKLRECWSQLCRIRCTVSLARCSAWEALTAIGNSSASNMPAALRNTVDRLDKPSAYYHGKVGFSVSMASYDNMYLP